MDDSMVENEKEFNPVGAQSLLTGVIETRVLPPERFGGKQEGVVEGIAKIGDVVATLRNHKDHYEVEIYDGKGNSWQVHLDPTIHEIAKKVGYGGIRKNNDRDQSYTNRLSDVIQKFWFDADTARHMAEDWYREKSSMYKLPSYAESYSEDRLASEPDYYLPAGEWKMGTLFFVNEDGKQGKQQFILTVGDSWFYVDPDKQKTIKKTIVKDQISKETVTEVRRELPNKSVLKTGQRVFYIYDEGGRELASYAGEDTIQDPSDKNKVYFINAGRIYSLDTTGVATRTAHPTLEVQFQVNNPQELEFDPNGNFLIIRGGDGKLAICDKTSGGVAHVEEGVKGPFIVDEQGDIIYVDLDNRLNEIQTNFQAIPPGGNEQAQKLREERLKALKANFEKLDLNNVEAKKRRKEGIEITEDEVATTLRQTIGRQVSEKIANAKDAESLEEVLDKLAIVKNDPDNAAYGAIFDEFITQAEGKLSTVRTGELLDKIGAFEKSLDVVQSVGDTIMLDQEFATLLALRQQVDVVDVSKRKEVEQRLAQIMKIKDTLVSKFQGELIETARGTLPQILEQMRETGSENELAAIGSSSGSMQFEMMLANIRDPDVRRQLREQLTAAKNEQYSKIQERGRELAETQRGLWAQVISEVREDLESIGEQLSQQADSKAIDRFQRHPLVTAYRSKVLALPVELRDIEEKKLEILLSTRKRDIEHRKQLGAKGEAGELRFGDAAFPTYKEPPVIWQPKLVPFAKNSFYAELVYVDANGRVFKPNEEGPVVVANDPDDEKTKAAMEDYKKQAAEYFRNLKRQVPDFDDHWRITPFHMDKYEEIAETLNLQLLNHSGILILQGEAGTGKNVMIDMLANLSNREVVSVLCNENTVKEDLAYEFDYDPEKGTVRWPSRLLEGLRTPGTIILFDEINALKPGIAKMMNSLFDYRRRLSFTAGGTAKEIIADPTVIFVGTMNPQNYAGVNRLSPEVKSRSRVVDLDYPPFEERRGGRNHWRSDEAEMLSAYMEDLGDLTQGEFRLVWDYVVNKKTDNGADIIVNNNPKIEENVTRLYDVIRVANGLRKMYSAYQIGDSNEPLDFPTSLRELTDIAMEMNHKMGVKEIVKRVILPKIDERSQRRMVEQTIDGILPG